MSGWVYILSNPTMPGLFKIGYTEKDPISRAKEISDNTGVPLPYEVEYQIYTTHPRQIEQITHQRLEKFRINKKREFFKCRYEEIVEAIRETIKYYDTEWTNFSATGEMSYKILKEEIDRKIQEKLEKEWQRKIQQDRYRIAKQQEEKERLQRQKEQAEKERLQRQKEQAEKERLQRQKEQKEKIAKIRKQEADEINKLLGLSKSPKIADYIISSAIFIFPSLLFVLFALIPFHPQIILIISIICLFLFFYILNKIIKSAKNEHKLKIKREIKEIKDKYQTMINQIKPN